MDEKSLSHKMEVSISHSDSSKVPAEGGIWKTTKGHRRNTKKTMRLQKCRNNWSTCMYRPYSHAGKYTTKTKRIRFYGVFKREEFSDDIWTTCKSEIQIQQSKILDKRVLYEHGWNKQGNHSKIYPRTGDGRSNRRPDQLQRAWRPIQTRVSAAVVGGTYGAFRRLLVLDPYRVWFKPHLEDGVLIVEKPLAVPEARET